MADFATPFASQAGRRTPTADEKVNGFPCGPADQTLFNGLFHRLESEIGNVISYAGLTGSDADYAQLRKAIVALIDAATGGGSTDSYLLMSQATARLPIYPEMMTEDRKINISSPATGVVRVPGGIDFLHRGIFQVTTEETDFNTQASKTYHLRWNPGDGFTLNDLSSGTYNPSAAAETSTVFDSSYDDMLLARVVTNSSNVATITNLANAHDLRASGQVVNARGAFSGGEVTAGYEGGTMPASIANYNTVTLDWARLPEPSLTAIGDVAFLEFNVGTRALSRYQIAVWGQGDTDISLGWRART